MMDEQKFKEIVAANLTKYRKAYNLTQAELAEKLCYSDKAISKWERGESIPDAYTLSVIAEFYHITINDLYLEEKNEIVLNDVKPKGKHILILLLSFFLSWLVCFSIYFILATIPAITWDGLWIIILISLPVSFTCTTVFCALWFNNLCKALSVSAIVWGCALCIQLLINNLAHQSAWFIYIIATCLQILIILWFLLSHTNKHAKKEVN